jgi:hypothetical protein
MITHPENRIRQEIEKETRKSREMQFCFAYYKDLDEAYAFYCARYENISFEDFLKLPVSDFCRKLSSIPEGEPLYTIMKSRAIRLGKIKDKEQKKYWSELKKENRIPYAYYNNDKIEGINLGGII